MARAPSALPLDGRLWGFAIRTYAHEEAANACLALQDEHGLDIPLLLFAGWSGAERGQSLTDARLAEAFEAVAPWRDEVVVSLRVLRRRLKQGPAPAPSAATEPLRETIKHAELEAERVELAMLQSVAEGWPPAPRADATLAAMYNLDLCFRLRAGYEPAGEAGRGLARIAHACLMEARP